MAHVTAGHIMAHVTAGHIMAAPQLLGRHFATRGNKDAVQNSFVALYFCN
jgi:hypothetical protein